MHRHAYSHGGSSSSPRSHNAPTHAHAHHKPRNINLYVVLLPSSIWTQNIIVDANLAPIPSYLGCRANVEHGVLGPYHGAFLSFPVISIHPHLTCYHSTSTTPHPLQCPPRPSVTEPRSFLRSASLLSSLPHEHHRIRRGFPPWPASDMVYPTRRLYLPILVLVGLRKGNICGA